MRRVTFFTDPLRGELTQLPSVRNMAGWAQVRFLDALSELNVSHRWLVPKSEGGEFPDAELLSALDLPSTPQGWIQSTALTELPDAADQLLTKWFENELIVGFIPNWLKRFCNKYQIPYVDYEIDALRFTPDLFLILSTNIGSFADFAQARVVPDEALRDHALAYSNRVVVANSDYDLQRYRNDIIFFGQTEIDRALIEGGRLATVDSIGERLANVIAPFDRVLFKRHPYSTSDTWGKFISTKKPISVVDGPTYDILASSSCNNIAAISSGVLREARYFNVNNIVRLIDSDMYLASEPFNHVIAPVDGSVFAPSLIKHWLVPVLANGIEARIHSVPVSEEELERNIWFGKTRRLMSDIFRWSYGASGKISVSPFVPSERSVLAASETGVDDESDAFGGLDLGIARSLGSCASSVGPKATGFAAPDAQGMWMVAKQAEMKVRLKNARTSSSIIVTLDLTALQPPQNFSNVVQVKSASGRLLQHFTISKSYGEYETIRFRLTRNDGFNGDYIRFGLEVSSLVNMASEGAGGDDRNLGPCVASIQVDRPISFG